LKTQANDFFAAWQFCAACTMCSVLHLSTEPI